MQNNQPTFTYDLNTDKHIVNLNSYISNIENHIIKDYDDIGDCSEFDLPKRNFKKMFLYYFLLETLEVFKSNPFINEKVIKFDYIKDTKLCDKFSDYRYNLFLEKILKNVSVNLPLQVQIHDKLFSCKSNYKKIDNFITDNKLDKIKNKIYSVLLS